MPLGLDLHLRKQGLCGGSCRWFLRSIAEHALCCKAHAGRTEEIAAIYLVMLLPWIKWEFEMSLPGINLDI